MSLEQRIGQLIMIGTPAGSASSGAISAIGTYHVGSVILTGRSHVSATATRAITDKLQAATGTSTNGAKLIVAVDQEGGKVQVLQGPGFDRMPTALYQGTHYSLDQLRAHADSWGGELAAAGINLNLAPVMDTVSQSFAPKNAPVGYFDREYGYTANDVAMRATAFANGMRDAGLAVSIKHFPGLGRVTGNTDTTSGVTDTVTTRQSDSVGAFGVGINSGAPVVMMSTAVYSKIDPGVPAAFSSTIIQGMLRGDLGFSGVVISDSLDGAAQVERWSQGERAVKFVAAGGDIVLTTSSTAVAPMYAALLARANKDTAFRGQVDAAALRVLELKGSLGLLG
ncbi:MAG: glycoside hydrolase family 3 N-terminal domain-containing protein [Nakamurella sp.]